MHAVHQRNEQRSGFRKSLPRYHLRAAFDGRALSLRLGEMGGKKLKRRFQMSSFAVEQFQSGPQILAAFLVEFVSLSTDIAVMPGMTEFSF
jgi:hypothetical protein